MNNLIKKASIILGIIGLITAVYLNRTGRFAVKPFDYGGALTEVTASTTWPADMISVKVGIFVENIYDFNASSQSAAAEGLVWVTWPQVFQNILEREGLVIEQVVNPVNRVNSWDSTARALYAKPLVLPTGEYHQIVRFANRFYIDAINLHRYPFEQITFPIGYTLNVMSDAFDAKKVRLVADDAQSGVGAFIDVLGFKTDSFSLKEYVQMYPTSFGYRESGQESKSEFSQVRLEVVYKKSAMASIQQLILPLLVVMLMVIVAPNLDACLWDVRIAIPSTALLTLVFLQQGYRASLPMLPYLTFLDQIYAVCFIVTFALFVIFVRASNILHSVGQSERAETIARLNRVDSRAQAIFVAVIVVTTVLNYFFPLRF